ncbi:MAG: peptide-methionine (S)-S-oxide reductase MsrA [Lacticaseibacillus paracasei]
MERDVFLAKVTNLMLAPGTRAFEREQLRQAKHLVEAGRPVAEGWAQLESSLRPLAMRDNLTPDVADFYRAETGDPAGAVQTDLSAHFDRDMPFQERAIFAGGCFWCMVEPFIDLPGITAVTSGYTGGHSVHPTYEHVIGGYTGHVEAVEIIFDTRKMSYASLVALYFQLTDPTDALGQFQDRGSQYRPVIFVKDDTQRQIAEAAKAELAASGRYLRPIITAIEPVATFWPAENYHQDFYKKNPKRYQMVERTRRQFLQFQRAQGNLRVMLKRRKKA